MSEIIKYNTIIGHDVSLAASFLKAGLLVAIPTETVYGLAGDATNESAILSIYTTKNRPHFNPLIMHVADITEIEKYAYINNDKLWRLASVFSPGPITYLLPKRDHVPDIATSGLSSVAIRIPAHPLALDLLRSLPFPLVAPSANSFGYISPTHAAHVYENFAGQIPYILDGGDCEVGLESTIISFLNEIPEILRYGGVTVESIEAVIGKVNQPARDDEFRPLAPGMLKSHYAPKIPLYFGLLNYLQQSFPASNAVLITLKSNPDFHGKQYILSESGDLKEAASRLFHVLREIDREQNVDKIYAMPVPSEGLGFAINDRLKRASKNNM